VKVIVVRQRRRRLHQHDLGAVEQRARHAAGARVAEELLPQRLGDEDVAHPRGGIGEHLLHQQPVARQIEARARQRG
jgi:hypothetical protein